MAEWLTLPRVALGRHAGRPVAVRGGERLDHADFARDVACWQAAFSRVDGRKVAVYFEDPYEFATALFGAWHAGKVAVLPGDAQPATVDRLLPEVQACAGDLPGALQRAARPAGELAPLDLQRTEAVIYTSGSSGQPVAIRKRLAQLDAEIAHLEQVFGARLAAQENLLLHATVSHQHIYGLLFVALWPLAAGRAVATERISYPEQIAQRLGERPGVLVSSPAHLRRLPEHLDWSGARGQLRAIFSSGGPLPPESADQAHALLGHSPIEVYGSSETGGVAWRQRAEHGDAWTPLPAVEWKLDEGVLCVRSDHLEDEGWWTTADLAREDQDGRFLLQGRVDRIAKVEEKRVSLAAVEQAIVATGEIGQARVLLVAGEGAQRLGAVMVPTESGWARLRKGGKAAMNDFLREQLAASFERVALPRRFRYVRELPVNSQGKSTEALLQQQFQAERPTAQWIERGETRAVATLEVVPELRVFDGHFPGTAVLPGVAQLDWVAHFGREAFALGRRFLRAEQLKFQSPVVPPAALTLEMEWHAGSGQLSFRFTSSQASVASGRLLFGAGDV